MILLQLILLHPIQLIQRAQIILCGITINDYQINIDKSKIGTLGNLEDDEKTRLINDPGLTLHQVLVGVYLNTVILLLLYQNQVICFI